MVYILILVPSFFQSCCHKENSMASLASYYSITDVMATTWRSYLTDFDHFDSNLLHLICWD